MSSIKRLKFRQFLWIVQVLFFNEIFKLATFSRLNCKRARARTHSILAPLWLMVYLVDFLKAHYFSFQIEQDSVAYLDGRLMLWDQVLKVKWYFFTILSFIFCLKLIKNISELYIDRWSACHTYQWYWTARLRIIGNNQISRCKTCSGGKKT